MRKYADGKVATVLVQSEKRPLSRAWTPAPHHLSPPWPLAPVAANQLHDPVQAPAVSLPEAHQSTTHLPLSNSLKNKLQGLDFLSNCQWS